MALGVDLPFASVEALALVCAGSMGAPVVAYAPEAVAPLAAAVERGERAPVRAVLALPAHVIADAELVAALGSTDAWFNLNTHADLVLAESRLAAGLAR